MDVEWCEMWTAAACDVECCALKCGGEKNGGGRQTVV